MKKTPPVTTQETLYSATTNEVRDEVTVKEQQGRLYALIGRRWCRVERRDDGTLIEVWTR